MGVSLVASFNKKIGRRMAEYPALGNGLEQLDKALEKAGLYRLDTFVSMDREEWKDMDPDDPDAEGMSPLTWYEPSDGLIVVDAAITHLRAKPTCLKWSAEALVELAQLRVELDAADKKKAQFHFEICD